MSAQLKEWAPAAMSVCAVLLTAIYAVTKESRAADGIRDARTLASSLSDAARTAEKTAYSVEQIEALRHDRAALEQRMEDSRKPSCVVAELTETARTTGLLVREIQPFGGGARPAGQQDQRREYPQYRIQVHGTYSQIAEYMARCGSQRIPVRIREFRVGRIAGQETPQNGKLDAELVVEVFQPLDSEARGSKGT
ncbi:MAG TPA: type 4a pilus biogenesis protein PilO [Phycisphaerae bacterium]|nr:type 4a pilus biogenesis protein PilO [Phycisphaerae bacterium]